MQLFCILPAFIISPLLISSKNGHICRSSQGGFQPPLCSVPVGLAVSAPRVSDIRSSLFCKFIHEFMKAAVRYFGHFTILHVPVKLLSPIFKHFLIIPPFKQKTGSPKVLHHKGIL